MSDIQKTFLGPGTITLHAVMGDGSTTPQPVRCGRGQLVVVSSDDPVLARHPEMFGEPGCLAPDGRNAAVAERERADALERKVTSLQGRCATLEGHLLAAGIDPDTGAPVAQDSAQDDLTDDDVPSGSEDQTGVELNDLPFATRRRLAATLGVEQVTSLKSSELNDAIGAFTDEQIAEALSSLE